MLWAAIASPKLFCSTFCWKTFVAITLSLTKLSDAFLVIGTIILPASLVRTVCVLDKQGHGLCWLECRAGLRQAQTCSAIGDDDPLPGFSSSLKVFRVLQGVRDDGKMALSCAAGLDPWLRQGHGF